MQELKLSNVTIRYIRVKPRAKQVRVILRVKGDVVHVSAPTRVSRAIIEQVIRRHERWIEEQLVMSAKRSTRPLTVGDEVWVAGDPWIIQPSTAQGIGLPSSQSKVCFDEEKKWIEVQVSDPSSLHVAVYEALRARARDSLSDRTRELSLQHGFAPNRITVKEQARRWGSCSTKGNINLNWRLVQAPIAVQTYVIVHELAHLREMNHGPLFWRLVSRMMPNYDASRNWLRTHGESLYRLQHDDMVF